MGGSVSKQNAYVLKVDPLYEDSNNISNSSALNSGPVPTTPPPTGLTRQSSKLSGVPAGNQSPGSLGRQNSGASLIKQGSVSGPGTLSKQNSRQASLRNMNVAGNSPPASKGARSSTVAVGGGRKVSSRLAWLLKDGSFGTNVDINSFEYGRVIGRGLMGSVRIAKHKQSGLFVAIKSIRKEYIQKHRDQRHIAAEKAVLTGLSKSPFCVRLFGTFQDTLSVHFVLELAVGGELFRRLQKKQAFPPAVAKFYASEIFCALRHVHKLGYVYRDLKPENIMLDEEGHCKLVDFGFSMKPDAQGLLHTNCGRSSMHMSAIPASLYLTMLYLSLSIGTPAYLSPEQLNGKFTNGYTSIVDWWSFGILLYELLTGNTPFCKSFSESSYEIYLRILENNISFPFGFDSVTKDLVTQLCHADLSKRLVDPEVIAASSYWEVSWEAVNNRWLVPPHVPRISGGASPIVSDGGSDSPAVEALDIGGDVSQFDKYSDGDKPMEGVGKVSSTPVLGEFNGF
jgi:serine/threonine protein kinase